MTGVHPDGPSLTAEDIASCFSKSFSYVPSSPPSSFRTPSSPTASVASSCESANDDSLHDCLSDADRCAHELTASMSTPSLPRSSVLYHGRLQRHQRAWSAMASPYIAGWIKDGVRVQFVRTPTRHRKVSRISNVRERLFAREQVAELLRRGVIGVDPTAEVICPLGVAPKKGPDLFRLIHNVRFVNEFCEPCPFTYEKLTDLQNVLKSGWWMGKLDLSAGYHHIPLHPSQHKFFGFEFEGKVYTWRQLFFGLSPAPYIFTMILRDVAKRWRFDGIFLIHYLDDFGVFAPTRELCLQQLTRIFKDLVALGFVVNLGKSVLDPVQLMEFLGYEVNTTNVPTFTVPPSRIAKLVADLHILWNAPSGRVRVRKVASVAGQLLSMSLALGPARLYTRALYRVVDSLNRIDLPGGWGATVTLSAAALSEVDFWIRGFDSWNGLPIFREAGVRVLDIWSDASHIHGWGGWAAIPVHVLSRTLSSDLVRTYDAQGRWTVLEAEDHINLQELRAFLFTAQSLAPVVPRGARIRPRLDNTVAISYLNNGGGRIPLLTEVVKQIWLLFVSNGWVLEPAVHIPGAQNVRADRLSRVFDKCDWKLNPREFAKLDALWGPHEHDRCASRVNRQNNLPFDSLYYEPGASGVDTFTQWWRETNNWVNGDFSQLGRLLALCRNQRACATFVVPRWARSWWIEFCNECVDWRELRRAHDLFLPGNHGNARAVGFTPWNMFAFRMDYRQESSALRERAARLPWRERHT